MQSDVEEFLHAFVALLWFVVFGVVSGITIYNIPIIGIIFGGIFGGGLGVTVYEKISHKKL